MNYHCKVYGILTMLVMSVLMYGQADTISVAERNAAQGFNDTIDRLAPDFVTVSLCIADPTTPAQDHSGIAGHAFLRLQCPTFGLDYCFSYESEPIKGQLWKLVSNQLKMGMLAVPTEKYISDYKEWHRTVQEYHINMSSIAEQRLWEIMDSHMMTEREVKIDYIAFGCANTIVRYVEEALLPDTILYVWPEKFYVQSMEEIVEGQLSNYPWELFLCELLNGKELRELKTLKQKLVYPMDLIDVWSESTINKEPILEYVGNLVEAEPVVIKKPWFTPQVCGILLLILIAGGVGLAIVRKRKK